MTSAPTVAVENVNDAPEGFVTVSSKTLEGAILTADVSMLSDLDGLGWLSFAWFRNGTII